LANKKAKWHYPFAGRSNGNPNDCWCDALALATGKTYDEIRTMFQPFIIENGGMNNSFISGWLFLNGYKRVDYGHDETTVGDLFQMLDSKNNDIVICTDGHVAYVSDNRIHDNIAIEQTSEYLKTIVESYFWKPKGERQKKGE
jgi:hypothetical protein